MKQSLTELGHLDDATIIDHLPDFISGLASWVEGDLKRARGSFAEAAESHAHQRLSYGIELETVAREYACLRAIALEECLTLRDEPSRLSLIRLNEGLDEAVAETVRRYTRRRDLVRDRFIGMLAHDLRNPLGSITMASGRVISTRANPADPLHKTGAIILRSAERMSRMIEDVVEFARQQLGGRLPIERSDCDMGEIGAEVIEELKTANPDREIVFRRHGVLNGRWDKDRVMQALSNVIGNAIQHGVDPIHVDVRAAGDQVQTAIANGGPPIPPEVLATLFDPFKPRRSKQSGLGLGLVIVRAIANAHAATVDVQSAEGGGLTFSICWPRDAESR